MAKMTKKQSKRMVSDIVKKTQKLYMMTGNTVSSSGGNWIVSTQEMASLQKLSERWMKRLG